MLMIIIIIIAIIIIMIISSSSSSSTTSIIIITTITNINITIIIVKYHRYVPAWCRLGAPNAPKTRGIRGCDPTRSLFLSGESSISPGQREAPESLDPGFLIV